MRSWRYLLPLLLLPLIALARAGGGEDYRSGNDPGGDGIPLDLIILLVELVFRHPEFGIPLIVVVGIVWTVQKRRRASSSYQRKQEEQRGAARTGAVPGSVEHWVGALQQQDPAFRLEPLLERARGLVQQVNEAWFLRDLSVLRPFLSDATWQRLSTQLTLMDREGRRDAIADLQVLEVSPIGFERNDWYDTLHLRVRAQIRDAEVPSSASDEAARAKAQGAPLETFTEVWSFSRRPGAQTRAGHDLSQGNCPGCGAPFRGGATNACEYCGAIANAGTFDWTLSQISQGSAWTPRAAAVLGQPEFTAHDPALSVNQLEDRAALLFWRWILALGSRDVTPLLKVAAPSMRAPLEAAFQAGGSPLGALQNVALGAARLTRLRLGRPAADGAAATPDLAEFEVRWSARLRGAAAATPQRWAFVLARKHGALTPQGHGIASSRCSNCHGPLTDSASTRCDFCGSALDAGGEWVLFEARP